MVEIVRKNWFLIVVGIIVLVILFVPNSNSPRDETGEEDITPLSSDPGQESMNTNEPLLSEIIVDVKGEVSSPGIYSVDDGARVNDVIKLAGGFTKEADQTHVNLAQIVQDEMVVMVPKIGDGSMDEVGGSSGSSGPSSGKVRINYAAQEEIETLTGIGPSKAKTIIQHREENGLFKNIEELLNVSGIGEKTLENIRDQIVVP